MSASAFPRIPEDSTDQTDPAADDRSRLRVSHSRHLLLSATHSSHALLAAYEQDFELMRAALDSLKQTLKTHIESCRAELVPAAEKTALTSRDWYMIPDNETFYET